MRGIGYIDAVETAMEQLAKGDQITLEHVTEVIRGRAERDSGRKDAPMKAVAEVLRLVAARIGLSIGKLGTCNRGNCWHGWQLSRWTVRHLRAPLELTYGPLPKFRLQPAALAGGCKASHCGQLHEL
jgi:hypothetical protein